MDNAICTDIIPNQAVRIKTESGQTSNHTIEIKCADPNIIDKVKNL